MVHWFNISGLNRGSAVDSDRVAASQCCRAEYCKLGCFDLLIFPFVNTPSWQDPATKALKMSARSAPISRILHCCLRSNEGAIRGGRLTYSYNAIPYKRGVTNLSCSSLFTSLRGTGLRYSAPRKTIPCQTRMISSVSAKHRVYIALGSNLGDRIDMIEQACHLLDKHDKIKIKRTSCLWETKAMYVEDQADFLNGACEVGMLHRSARSR